MIKEKHGQFYNWALNTPYNWGEVKWLRGYQHPRVMKSQKQETLNSVFSKMIQKEKKSQLKGKNDTYVQS